MDLYFCIERWENIMEFISTSIDTKEQKPNIDLAIKLATTKDRATISEVVDNLKSKDKTIASDCIKVLYEIGKIEPLLIIDYLDTFLELISSKNNRMVWGAMYAVAQIAPYKIDIVNNNFDKIITAYENGSIITIDSCIAIFAEIAKAEVSNSKIAFDMIIKHLRTCRLKEIPQHSEKAFACVNGSNYKEFEQILLSRFDNMNLSQQKRVKKVLKKIINGEFD